MGINKHKIKIRRKLAQTHPFFNESIKFAAIVVGAAFVAVGLEFFLVPNGFLDGGVTGVAIIVSNLANLPLGLLLAVLNAPFVIIAWKVLGIKSALKTVVGIGTLSILTLAFHGIDPLTDEFILALGYGGVLLGVGVGLALRCGGALDGIESLAHILSEKTSIDVDKIILAFNFILFIIAAFLFSPEQAMASFLLFYIVVAPMINRITASTEYKTIQIISTEYASIVSEIYKTMHRKAIITSGIESDSKKELKIITVIIPRIEESTLVDYNFS